MFFIYLKIFYLDFYLLLFGLYVLLFQNLKSRFRFSYYLV